MSSANRQQRWVRETLIKVFHDDAGFPQRQLAVNQGRYAVIGVEVNQILRQVIRFNMLNFNANNTLMSVSRTHL